MTRGRLALAPSGPGGRDGNLVRVIGLRGEELGLMTLDEASRLAEEQGAHLVLVSPRATPPVYKLVDLGKFKYELSKDQRTARAARKGVRLKEVKLRPTTAAQDFERKLTAIRRFLVESNPVRVVVTLRGRENAHPEEARRLLARVERRLDAIARIEAGPILDGRRLTLTLSPRRGG